MAIEFFEGFEATLASSSNPDQPGWVSPVSFGGFSTVSRSGNWGMGAGSGGNATLSLPATAKKTLGIAWWLAGAFGSTAQFIQVCADAAATIHLTLMTDATGHLQLRRGTTAGTVIATSTQVIDVSVWRYVEIQATIDDATGRCIVRVDEAVWIDFTGDTRNAGTSVNIDAFKFSFSSSSARCDDIYVTNGTDATATTGRADNDFLGDVKVEGLLPTTDGASTQWTPSTGTNHAATVDEVTPSSADYVGTVTDGNRDLWNVADVSASAAQVLAVRSALTAAKSDAGSATLKSLLRTSDGTVTAEASSPLSVSYTTIWGALRTTKPGGGAWTPAEVNALQIGAEKQTT